MNMTGEEGRAVLAARITDAPGAADQERAMRCLQDLRGAAEQAGAGRDLEALFARFPGAAQLLAGVFSASPFLTDLAVRDPRRLITCLDQAPERFLSALLQDLPVGLKAAHGIDAAMPVVRRFRDGLALLVGLADIAGAWSIDDVTRALSAGADAALSASVDFLLRDAARNGDARLADPVHPSKGSGYIVLGMGKLGARELNYSSDVDLIVFYEPGVLALRDGLEPAKFFVRITRGLVKLMQERTADGYAFRVDLRLRPDPGATSAAISLPAALQYYESMGQNWERAALIKARPVAGDIAAGNAFLKELSPFIWRKYFDFAAITDVHAMKRQIHAYKGHGRIAVAGHNIKLGRGGIREVEFFVQTQQLIAGGRQPDLRGRETIDMLARLTDAGWIDAKARDELAGAYRFLRRIEHRLQMQRDEQVYTLPDEPAALDAFAVFCGFDNAQDFGAALTKVLERVQGHYAALFEDAPDLGAEAGNLVFTGGEDDPGTLETLSRMGYSAPADVARIVRSWHFGRYPATRSERARERLTELVPALLKVLSETANPQAAFIAFDGFIARLPAGVQLFSLLRANPGLLSLIADIVGTAPRLASILSRHANVLDAVLAPDFFGGLPTRATLAERFDILAAEARGYEDLLDRARRFGQEQSFLIGVRILSGTVTAGQAGGAYAALASLLVDRLHTAAAGELTRAHGHVPGGAAAVVAMGKLGGAEMTATSDLDLIVIYDFPPDVIQSDGARPIAPGTYYARLAQRFVAALSAPTAEGTLYEVDLRLRPSGNKGPLAASLASFKAYHAESAWTWEHMALTRARTVAGGKGLRAMVEAEIRTALSRPRDRDKLVMDVVEMRGRMDREKGTSDPWAIKTVPGGLIDVEFIAQYLQLAHAHERPDVLDQNTAEAVRKLAVAGVLDAHSADVLREACTLYHNLTQVMRLALEGDFDPAAAPRGLQALLARAGNLPDFSTLDAYLRETEQAVREVFVKALGSAPWKART